ncbi:MAG: hypothetical protein K9J30_09370 [Bacteroidales bacterium]|nr:hypothetical protein [Bacteroidales bacterium]
MRMFIIPVLLLAVFISGCNNQPPPVEQPFKPDKITSEIDEVKEIIYSIYLPTDMTFLFSEAGINFNPDIPAPIDNFSLYITEEQIAIMLGVYGVDMMYMKLLDQQKLSGAYFHVIKTLSENINVPRSIFDDTTEKLELYVKNKDSIASLVDIVYRQTDRFFKENGNDHLAALTLLGGWIETMYIGTRILKTDSLNNIMAERILQQKYSLNSVYTILSNYQESLNIRGYLLMLKKLRKEFDNVDIKYQKEGFNIDTSEKKIQTYNTKISYTSKTLDNILALILLIREETIRMK